MRRHIDVIDKLAAAIVSGELRPGSRLPPQRLFAYEHGMAVSTANRIYSELGRRGLVSGEVGRGTFVSAPTVRDAAPSAEPSASPVDLQMSVSLLPEQIALMVEGVGGRLSHDLMSEAARPIGPAGPKGAGELVAEFLRGSDWAPDPRTLLFAGNGRQGIAAALSALARPGDRIGVEPLTYPIAKSIAARLGLQLVAIRCDQNGVDLDDLRRAHALQPLSGLYLQPTLHNPTGWTMAAEHRRRLAELLMEKDLVCVEDAVYSFLKPTAPLAAYAPDHVILVDSLSKRLTPAVGMGFVATPARLTAAVATALRSGAGIANGLSAALALRWIETGAVARIAELKRIDALRRQEMARAELDGFAISGDAAAYHFWLDLPPIWRADLFTAAAALQGVAVSPASAFAVMPAHAPNALRIAISAPPIPDMLRGLRVIRRLLQSDPAETSAE